LRVFELLGRFTVKFKWLILLFWIIAIPVANHYLPSFSSVTQSSNSGFLPQSSPFTIARNLENPFFAGKDPSATATVVVSRSDGPLTAADKAAVAGITAKLQAQSSVVNFVRDEGVSKDGEVQQLLVATTESNGQDGSLPQAESDIAAIRNAVASVAKPTGLTTHVTGTLAEAVDSNSSNKTERSGATYYSIILIIILLLIVFRSALAPLVTLAPAVVALVIAEPIIAEATKLSSAIQVSFITQLLLIVLILGAGTDYGLFLIFRVREELRRGLTPHEAVIRGLTRVGESITFSAATVIAALLSLLFATFGLYRGLGPGLAIGLFVMLLAALTLLPALLAILGRAVFWPSKTHAQDAKVGLWGRVADTVIKRPVLMLVIGVVVLGGLAAGVVGFTIGGFSDTSGVPANSDSAQGQAIISQHFPAATASPQTLLVKYTDSVWTNLTALNQLQTKLTTDPVYKSVEGPFNPGGFTVTPAQLAGLYKQLGPPANLAAAPPKGSKIPAATFEMYRSMAQFISPDGKTVQFYATLTAGPGGSTAAMDAMPQARLALTNDASSAVSTGILSEDAASYDIDNSATGDLEHIIPIVLLIIAVLLAIMLRSLVAPLYLIVTVGLSYVASLGFAMILFVHIRHDDGLIFILPFLMFVFSMALGEDYNILVMSRIREEAHHTPSLKAAVAKAIGVTGTTVTSAGLILAGTFTVLGFVSGGTGGASGDTVMQIGLSIAFGVLLDTFFVRTLLVPSIAVLLGSYNWWPSNLHVRHKNAAAPDKSKPSLS
jgi:RND superfamily putative drug exporter